MAWRGVPPIPPYAGVCSEAEATRPGYGVQRTVELLLRYHYVQQRLMALGVARLPGTPEWEVKAALGLHAWYDAEQTDGWRRRVAELREPPLHLERCPDAALGAWLDELEAAPGTPELVDGIYAVARPALAAAFARQLREANPLADHPTRRLLRIALAEQEEAIAWGAAAAAALVSARSEAERGAAAQWRRRLEAGLAAAGGLAAEAPPAGAAVPPAPRRALPDLTPRRDGRFADQRSFGYVCDEVAQDAARPPRERAWALVFKRLREMDVPEWMAGIIAETPEAPWEYPAT